MGGIALASKGAAVAKGAGGFSTIAKGAAALAAAGNQFHASARHSLMHVILIMTSFRMSEYRPMVTESYIYKCSPNPCPGVQL